MIRFIYGEYGFGKTRTVMNMLKEDAERGVRSFLIVPEQMAVSGERMMLDLLPPSAQLTTEVLNFSRLYNRVCREYGGLEYNYVTTPSKYLIMWKCLRELSPMLEHYNLSSELEMSTIELMLGAVGEFKANSVTPSALERASDKLQGSAELTKKLRDIALIYSAYCALVSESFSDSSDDISKLYDALKLHDFFKGYNVYIDSFSSFTSAEHKVISRIFAQAENVTVTIPLPSPRYEAIYTASISASEKKLIRAAEDHGGYTTEILKENKRAHTEDLAYLSRELWELGIAVQSAQRADKDTQSVVLESCANPYSEAEAAARWSLELMRQGIRCRDIAIVARDAEKYRGIIEPAMERCGVPYFFSEKSDLCSKSPIKFILSALRIKNHGWRSTDVISHLKTGLYDIPLSSVDMFESYVKTWNIKGGRFTDGYWTMNPDGYTEGISERGQNILTEANSVREKLCEKLIPLFAKLDAADNAAECCRAIYEYLTECNVEEKLTELSSKAAKTGEQKTAQEYSSLYSVILNTLANVSEILSDTGVNTQDLEQILTLVFDMTEIGTIPTSVDEVTVGSANMLRVENPRCVIVIGLRDGEFPRGVTDTGILNSAEKAMLSELGIEFSTSREIRSSDELLFVKRAFSLPAEKLILITSTAEADGSERHPSLAYTRAKKLLPHISEHRFEEADISYLTPTDHGAARYIHSQSDPSREASLRSALLSRGENFEYLRADTPKELSVGECKISQEIAEQIFPSKMRLSQSKLEKYIRCNFSYYCSYVLDLRNDAKAEFRSSEIGTFVHFILERLISEIFDECGLRKDIDDSLLSKLTDDAVRGYVQYICPSYERATGRFTHLYRRLRNLSMLLIKNIISEFSASDFIPSYFELNIGGGENSPRPLEFIMKDGSRVSLSGKIDRVDILKRDGQVYVRVVDYKTGTKNFSLSDLKLGLNTQMLIYLFTLCARPSPALFGVDTIPNPAGVVYLSSNIPTVELEDYSSDDEILSKADSALDRSGLLLDDEDILRAMNCDLSPKYLAGIKQNKSGELSGSALTSAEDFEVLRGEIEEVITSIAAEMKSGIANAYPLVHGGTSPCDYCEMKPVCRRNPK